MFECRLCPEDRNAWHTSIPFLVDQHLKNKVNDNNKALIQMFHFVHILKTIRNNWLNLKNEDRTFIYPKREDSSPADTRYPLNLPTASFNDIQLVYKFEHNFIARFALTAKACWSSKLEHHN